MVDDVTAYDFAALRATMAKRGDEFEPHRAVAITGGEVSRSLLLQIEKLGTSPA